MMNRRLLITTISLLLSVTTLWGGGPQARAVAPGVTEKAAAEYPAAQAKAKRQRRKRRPAPRPQTYSNDLEGLRAQFNRDKGRVRLLMLLSPT